MSIATSLRKRLLSSAFEKSYGPLLFSASPTIAELMSNVGYGHIVVDMEHSPLEISSTLQMLRAIDASSSDICTIVRAPAPKDITMTKKILDILKLPGGIMFPMVESQEDAKLCVESTRYPPHYPGGVRGCAYPLVRASSYGKEDNYFSDKSHQDLLTLLQVESENAIRQIPEIGMVDGVDCIFLGPFDISCSIGEVGDFSENSKTLELIREAEALVRQTSEKRLSNGMDRLLLGGFKSPGRSLEEMFSKDVNYQLLCGSVDLSLIQKAAMDDWNNAKKAMDS